VRFAAIASSQLVCCQNIATRPLYMIPMLQLRLQRNGILSADNTAACAVQLVFLFGYFPVPKLLCEMSFFGGDVRIRYKSAWRPACNLTSLRISYKRQPLTAKRERRTSPKRRLSLFCERISCNNSARCQGSGGGNRLQEAGRQNIGWVRSCIRRDANP